MTILLNSIIYIIMVPLRFIKNKVHDIITKEEVEEIYWQLVLHSWYYTRTSSELGRLCS